MILRYTGILSTLKIKGWWPILRQAKRSPSMKKVNSPINTSRPLKMFPAKDDPCSAFINKPRPSDLIILCIYQNHQEKGFLDI